MHITTEAFHNPLQLEARTKFLQMMTAHKFYFVPICQVICEKQNFLPLNSLKEHRVIFIIKDQIYAFFISKSKKIMGEIGKIDAANRPYLRTTKRRADAMFSRLKGNLGFERNVNPLYLYADVPAAEDDPYRYFHW